MKGRISFGEALTPLNHVEGFFKGRFGRPRHFEAPLGRDLLQARHEPVVPELFELSLALPDVDDTNPARGR